MSTKLIALYLVFAKEECGRVIKIEQQCKVTRQSIDVPCHIYYRGAAKDD